MPSSHRRKAHIRSLGDKVVPVAEAIVSRTGPQRTREEIEQALLSSGALNDIAADATDFNFVDFKDGRKEKDGELPDGVKSDSFEGLESLDNIEITTEDQIFVLSEAKKLVEKDIASSAKVGFLADVEDLQRKQEFLVDLECKLSELNAMSLKEIEFKVHETAKKMSGLSTTGFVSQRGEAEALLSYMEELLGRMGAKKEALKAGE